MFLQILTVQHDSASWIMDAIRWVFWFLAKVPLILLDGIFVTINDIWKFKFFDNNYVNTIYKAAIIVACTWLALKVILELIMRYFVKQDDNSSPTSVFKGLIVCIVMMFLVPPLFNWGYDLSSKMTQYVISASSTAEESPVSFEASMSSMILTAFADDKKMEEEDKKYFIENWFTTDYNEVINDGLLNSGEYKYSFNTFPIFITGFIIVILLFFIGIQVAKRVIELALYKAIAPFVCTSLVSNRSHAFEVWIKGVVGTFLVTAVQYLCIGILFNVFGSVIDGTTFAMSVILIIIGCLLFIISSPQLISALLNANTSTMSNASELHSIFAMGTSLVAMSKYGKTIDSSNNNNNNVNSTSNNSNDSSSSGGDSDINSASNMGDVNQDFSNHNNNSSEDNSSYNNSDISDFEHNNSDIDFTTSLEERINAYNDLIGSRFSFEDSNTLYNINDWGNLDVSNTKEYKS